MKHPLNEAWDSMVREGILDPAVNSVAQPNTQQPQNPNQQMDPNKIKQVEIIKQQIRDIDSKIAPLADKKRKLEDQLSKMTK
jgi:hypothetical protein